MAIAFCRTSERLRRARVLRIRSVNPLTSHQTIESPPSSQFPVFIVGALAGDCANQMIFCIAFLMTSGPDPTWGLPINASSHQKRGHLSLSSLGPVSRFPPKLIPQRFLKQQSYDGTDKVFIACKILIYRCGLHEISLVRQSFDSP